MERFWKAALGVGGLAAVGFFVLFSLYKGWLRTVAPVLSQMDKNQTFVLMLVFLVLTFFAMALGVWGWLKGGNPSGDLSGLNQLESQWKNLNGISCDNLIGPDVNKAAEVLKATSTYWRRSYANKDAIMDRFGDDFLELFDQLDGCDKPVPGYTNPVKTCKDFLTFAVRSTYKDMRKRYAKAHAPI